jgi:predicted dehydrogenase
MDSDGKMDRRTFIRTTAGVAAGAAAWRLSDSRVLGANDRLRVGIIGAGIRGFYLLNQALRFDDIDMVAVGDTYTGWVKRAMDKIKPKYADVKGYPTYRQLLDAKDIDAVIVATPEHSHHVIVIDAIKSGRDVYCEKPMVHHWQEALKVVNANAQAKRIIQVGTQRRSNDLYMTARDIVQSGGIGEVYAVRAWWDRNSDSEHPQWRYPIPEDASEKTCNWPEFLCRAPKRPFSKERYFQWRCYWDYSGGIAGDLMVHQVDAINMVMGSHRPVTGLGHGRIFRWNKRDRETPDVWNAVIEYPAGSSKAAPTGFMIGYASTFSNSYNDYGEQFLGTDGTIVMNDRKMSVYAEPEQVRSRAVEERTLDRNGNDVSAHLRDFFDACKSRHPAHCTERDGADACIASSLTVLSHLKGKRMEWDGQRVKGEG